MKVTYEPSCGENIKTTIEESLRLSNYKNLPVEFTFNGVTLLVGQSQSVEYYVDLFQQKISERQEAYNKSKKRQFAEKRRKLNLLSKQETLDSLVQNLPSEDNDVLVDWLISFVEASDYIGVSYDKLKVITHLYKLGFVRNMWVGFAEDWTPAHELEWIVGQILDCLERIGMIPPIALSKLEDWRDCNV